MDEAHYTGRGEEWVLTAFDLDNDDRREFAMRNIHGWHYPVAEEQQ